MRAALVRRFGGPEALQLKEVPDPTPGPGQVRIAVAAAGVNPVDTGIRADGSWAGIDVPCVLGYDVAGVVDEVGDGVDAPARGDRVMAMTSFPRGAGGYAELVVTEADLVASLGDDVDLVGAAATPLAAGTAIEVLARLACPPGSSLLALGGSGGVGLFLVELAARSGARVIGVGRRESHDRMLERGATACVDYRDGDVASAAVRLADGPVDAIADLVGGPPLATALGALRAFGSVAYIATPELDVDLIADRNLTVHGVLIGDDGSRTRRLASMLDAHELTPHVAQVFALGDAAEAHRLQESGRAGGKIVLTVA